MLDTPNRGPVNIGPIDALIQVHVQLAYHQDVVAAQDVETGVLDFEGGFAVRLDDALLGFAENEVGDLVGCQEIAD